MIRWLKRTTALLLVWWRNGKTTTKPPNAPDAPYAEPAPEKKPDMVPVEPSGAFASGPGHKPWDYVEAQTLRVGQFYFREAILDDLDEYFVILKSMKRHDPDAYELFSRVGAYLTPKVYGWGDPDKEELSPWWKTNRPGFGAVMFSHLKQTAEEEKKRKAATKKQIQWPRMLYFHKYKRERAPLELQKVHEGDIYKVTVYWHQHDDKKRKHTGSTDFGVALHADGTVQVLLVLRHDRQHIRATRLTRRGREFSVPQTRWCIDPFFASWAREHKTDPVEYLRGLFCQAANMYESANYSMIRVDVNKNNLHAAFGVDMERTPYFFKDREVSVNDKGNKKRIFHIVRAHTNKFGTFIKTHFRGERSFDWNGYRINIVVPEREQVWLPSMDVGCYDMDASRAAGDDVSKQMSVAALAAVIRGKILDKTLRGKTLH